MNSFSKIAAFIPFGALLLIATLWSGCHSVEVDDSASVYESLATATTETQAKAAILRTFRELGSDKPADENLMRGYAVEGDQLNALSTAQAAYNSGNREVGRTMREVYELAIEIDREPSVDLDRALAIFAESADRCLPRSDDPEYMGTVLAAMDDDQIPESLGLINADETISPFQAFMFAVWLDREGPGLWYLDGLAAGKSVYTIPACGFGFIDITIDSETCTGGFDPCPQECIDGAFCTVGACGASAANEECYESYVACQNATPGAPACDTALATCLAAHPTEASLGEESAD